MRELIGRLEVVDDTAASALRVIAHFDSLVEARASVPALIRAAAVLAGCPVGLHEAATGTTRVIDPTGQEVPATTGPATDRQPVDPERGSSVWLERHDEPGPLDALILERLAKALQTRSVGHADTGVLEVAVRVACDADLDPGTRAGALRALGLRGRVTVLATLPDTKITARRSAIIDGWRVVLLADGEPVPDLVARQHVGTAVVDAAELPVGLAHAVLARRLADGLDPAGTSVAYESLGPLAELAGQLATSWVTAVPEVAAFATLATEHPWVPGTVHAVIGYPSARQAAAHLQVHHSTLQERVVWLESRLGYSLRDPDGRHRASLTLALWRIGTALRL